MARHAWLGLPLCRMQSMVFPIQTARKAAHMSRGLGLAQKHFCCDACCACWWATVCQRCHVGGRTWSALLATCGMDANYLEYCWCNLRGLAYPVLESKDPEIFTTTGALATQSCSCGKRFRPCSKKWADTAASTAQPLSCRVHRYGYFKQLQRKVAALLLKQRCHTGFNLADVTLLLMHV